MMMSCIIQKICRFTRAWHGIALCVAFVGCAGGSGSSGFDITPLAEDRLILQALAEGRCVDADGLPICPSDTDALALPAPLDQPGLPLRDVSLSTGISGGASRCQVLVSDATACAVQVVFMTGGLPAGANVQVALRGVERTGETIGLWEVGPATTLDGETTVATPVLVPVAYGRVQLAALVFLSSSPLSVGTIDRLAEAGADIVFVTDSFDIETH